MPSETRGRDVLDVVLDIYTFGVESATTAELHEVIEWLRCAIDNRRAVSPRVPEERTDR